LFAKIYRYLEMRELFGEIVDAEGAEKWEERDVGQGVQPEAARRLENGADSCYLGSCAPKNSV